MYLFQSVATWGEEDGKNVPLYAVQLHVLLLRLAENQLFCSNAYLANTSYLELKQKKEIEIFRGVFLCSTLRHGPLQRYERDSHLVIQ